MYKIIILSFTFCLAACAVKEQPTLYTAHNLWYEQSRINSINYKSGTLLQAGTPLGRKPYNLNQWIYFEKAVDGKDFSIYFDKNFYPDLSLDEFSLRLFTNRTFDQLTEGLTEKEINAVRHGVLVSGMSKRAVLLAYGYPPSHHTPDLKKNRWLYWVNRMNQKEICFDEKELTIRCSEANDDLL